MRVLRSRLAMDHMHERREEHVGTRCTRTMANDLEQLTSPQRFTRNSDGAFSQCRSRLVYTAASSSEDVAADRLKVPQPTPCRREWRSGLSSAISRLHRPHLGEEVVVVPMKLARTCTVCKIWTHLVRYHKAGSSWITFHRMAASV